MDTPYTHRHLDTCGAQIISLGRQRSLTLHAMLQKRFSLTKCNIKVKFGATLISPPPLPLTFVDDPQGHFLLHSSFQCEVLLQHFHARAACVVIHVCHGKLLGDGRQHICTGGCGGCVWRCGGCGVGYRVWRVGRVCVEGVEWDIGCGGWVWSGI